MCFGLLLARVGSHGHVIGIDESPEMVLLARERVARSGWPDVTVVQSLAEDASIAVTADAALFCAVHDILRSPDGLRNVMAHLRPGAWVAAGGGKWAAPWLAGRPGAATGVVGLGHSGRRALAARCAGRVR